MRSSLNFMQYEIPFPNQLHRAADKSVGSIGVFFLLQEMFYIKEVTGLQLNEVQRELDISDEELTEYLKILSSRDLIKVEANEITCPNVTERIGKIKKDRAKESDRKRKYRNKGHENRESELPDIDIPEDEVPITKPEPARIPDEDYKRILGYFRMWNERFHTAAQKERKDVLEKTFIKLVKEKGITPVQISVGIAFMETAPEKVLKTNIADWARDGLFYLNKDELNKKFFGNKKTGELTPYSQTGNPPVEPINIRRKREEAERAARENMS